MASCLAACRREIPPCSRRSTTASNCWENPSRSVTEGLPIRLPCCRARSIPACTNSPWMHFFASSLYQSPSQAGARLPGVCTLLRNRGRCIGVRKTRVCPRTEFSRERRCFLGSEELSTIAHEQATVQTLLYLDMGPSVAGLLGFREQLQSKRSPPLQKYF